MKKFLIFKNNNLILINFDHIFSNIGINCLNDLQNYGLIKNYQINLSNGDTKKLIYHHVIHGICEEILSNKHKYRNVIIIPPDINSNNELLQYCEHDKLQKCINKLLKIIHKSLPFVMYTTKYNIFNDSTDEGYIVDLCNILSGLYNDKRDKSFTFERIKQFSSMYDLRFLSMEYFNSIKTRLLLY